MNASIWAMEKSKKTNLIKKVVVAGFGIATILLTPGCSMRTEIRDSPPVYDVLIVPRPLVIRPYYYHSYPYYFYTPLPHYYPYPSNLPPHHYRSK